MGINSGSLIFKKVFAGKASSDNTKPFFEEAAQSNARLSVFSGDVWSEAHLIPNSGIGHITGSVTPGGFTASGVVKYYSASGFGPIAGEGFGFSSSIKDWIPFNFGDGTSYFYKLLANNGQEILISDPSNWTFDTEAGVLIFHNGYPIDPLDGTQLVNNTNLLPSMSAYAYTGKKLSQGLETGIITASIISTSGTIIASNFTGSNASFANITSSGNISASGNILVNSITASGNILVNKVIVQGGTGVTPGYTFGLNTSSGLFQGTSNNLSLQVAGGTTELSLSTSSVVFNVPLDVKGNITASGNISASGDISANTFTLNGINLENVSSTVITSTTTNFSGSVIIGSGSSLDSPAPIDNFHRITGSLEITGSGIFPNTDGTIDLGDYNRKFSNLYAVNTFFGGVHEINLETEGLDQMQEGTILSLKNGTLQPCEKEADSLVMGIVSKGKNFPIVLGAEPVLITGKIKAGDYIITSKIKGHGKGINPKYIYSKQLFGKIIAQAIEDGKGKSYLIKAMIRKM